MDVFSQQRDRSLNQSLMGKRVFSPKALSVYKQSSSADKKSLRRKRRAV
jgi:hypothetical protein